MPFPADVEEKLDVFLQQFCPDPATIRSALERTRLGTVHDVLHGESICRRGERVRGCWLIISGQVEVLADEQIVVFRTPGELFGEQGLVHVLSGKDGTRTADVRAVGPVKLLCIDASFQERLQDREKVVWTLTLASVINQKLEQATDMRSELRSLAGQHELLLRRFSDGDALGIVKMATRGERPAIQNRRAIIFFSDIAGFSVWSASRPSTEVAAHLSELAAIQINAVRDGGGQVDKLMGDGAMAYWFVDSGDREKCEPAAVLACVLKVVSECRAYFEQHGLPLGLRIGLHAGDVAFGDFGAENRVAVTLLGAAVNTAARYEQAKSSELGEIRISPTLRDLMVGSGADPDTFRGPTKVEVKHGVELDVYSI
ncbi:MULTISPECIES: cyclic nucleotide-binding domain-containing protein [unclassified Bradyrhizobium]|uniref:adenylate/guanylate cyclase domain-containing protein n=1 Tax=unclassified Bradyrhizobium TaxID=2631580 RepID=UPI001FFABD1B|nr:MULTISPECIES: cyclic nucleotide-binding domain-containing protein [unclassified Bradyrhizobium]MCK1408260.1 cyclic nucleotide-binding domain-containing protein [Bradyrhizobium sp. 76]UPJ62053.1 cyclic nucleotide-binding domain-containing protein [Bradyrhizobium sp. 192]